MSKKIYHLYYFDGDGAVCEAQDAVFVDIVVNTLSGDYDAKHCHRFVAQSASMANMLSTLELMYELGRRAKEQEIKAVLGVQ